MENQTRRQKICSKQLSSICAIVILVLVGETWNACVESFTKKEGVWNILASRGRREEATALPTKKNRETCWSKGTGLKGRVICRLATPSGNRTRVSPVAGAYSTTRPTVSEAAIPPSVRCAPGQVTDTYTPHIDHWAQLDDAAATVTDRGAQPRQLVMGGT